MQRVRQRRRLGTYPGGGFTLIEILIVISIIAVLASMILGGVSLARRAANKALAQTQVDSLKGAINQYYSDTGKFPGTEIKDGINAFPSLYEALCGEKPPEGKGGPSAPYVEIKQTDIAVWDEDVGAYRRATTEELSDRKVEKYVLDPWGMPYQYRENKSRARKPPMKQPSKFDVYSTGPNKEDETSGESEEESDDLGSW